MLPRRAYIVALITAIALSGMVGRAQSPPERASQTPNGSEPEVDDELLEFLGSLDAEDDEWLDYLSTTDVVAVAKARRAAQRDEDE